MVSVLSQQDDAIDVDVVFEEEVPEDSNFLVQMTLELIHKLVFSTHHIFITWSDNRNHEVEHDNCIKDLV